MYTCLWAGFGLLVAPTILVWEKRICSKEGIIVQILYATSMYFWREPGILRNTSMYLGIMSTNNSIDIQEVFIYSVRLTYIYIYIYTPRTDSIVFCK
jgi:hypothetical protein